MAAPKRHHWWPMVQSRYWTDADGCVTVTRADGSSFRTNPVNIGVESELYSRFLDDDSKDTTIEDWFGEAIDGPATALIEHLLDPANARRKPFRGDPKKADTVRALGFRVTPYVERIVLPRHVRRAISEYIAALLVRHPRYLAQLVQFHSAEGVLARDARNLALDNMVHLFKIYANRISTSMFIVTRRVGLFEYLYADGGVSVEEPWRSDSGVPFDIHAPITPDIALQVLPIPLDSSDYLDYAYVSEAKDQGVARQNRIVLGGAYRFVFCRGKAPGEFIARYFGRPAPKNIGYRVQSGRLETWYDPNRQ